MYIKICTQVRAPYTHTRISNDSCFMRRHYKQKNVHGEKIHSWYKFIYKSRNETHTSLASVTELCPSFNGFSGGRLCCRVWFPWQITNQFPITFLTCQSSLSSLSFQGGPPWFFCLGRDVMWELLRTLPRTWREGTWGIERKGGKKNP